MAERLESYFQSSYYTENQLDTFQGCSATAATESRITCHWRFTYRDPTAEELQLTLRDRVEQCISTDQRVEQDDQVNHPDSYYADTFVLDQSRLTLSRKDKAELDATFVFYIWALNP